MFIVCTKEVDLRAVFSQNVKEAEHVEASLSANYRPLPVTDRRSKIKGLHSFCNLSNLLPKGNFTSILTP